MTDNVKQPGHYNQGAVECIDAIKAVLGDKFQAYCLGNVLKYIWRCEYKGHKTEDLKKAAQYLEWAIKEEEQ